MSLTARQRQAAEASGPVAILAGAGTGKTHTLGHRYLQVLRQGRRPTEIVAVTFTERAAHELRSRVRRYMTDAFGPDDPRLAELEAAPIGTVHSLCLRICRDHPEAAGVPHQVRVLDPVTGEAWLQERLDAALAELPAQVFAALPYERARAALLALARDPHRADAAFAATPGTPADRAARARREAVDSWLATPEAHTAEADLAGLEAGPPADAGERARRALLAATAAARSDRCEEALAAMHGVKTNVGSARVWGAHRDALRSALTRLAEALRAWRNDPRSLLREGPVDAVAEEVVRDLQDAWTAVKQAMQRAKRRASRVDFNDLELGAAQALARKEVIDHYARRWRELLLDEAQDTSPVQEEVLSRLARFCRATVVGDPKQSIYRFRGADPGVYARLRTAVADAGGETVVLDVGFRTHAPLMESGNVAFERLLGSDHQPLTAARRAAPQAGPHLRWWRTEAPADADASARRRAEAERIARELSAWLVDGMRVHDAAAPGGRRSLRPADVCLLARSWSTLDVLAEALTQAQVPAVLSGGGDLLATREAQDGAALLRFLAARDDDIALVALLRGPMFALADDALVTFADRWPDADGWWQRLQCAAEDGSDPNALRAQRILTRLQEAACELPPERLLRLADRLTGWSAVVAALPQAQRREADRRGFLTFVRSLQAEVGDVTAVARTLTRLTRDGAPVPRPPLAAPDAVTLTTVHRSKGLEWPVVVLAAADARGQGDREEVRFGPESGVAVRIETAEERSAESVAWRLAGAEEAKAREAEERRLAYVALTRAADVAVVSETGGSGALIALLRPGLEAAGATPEVGR